MASEPPLEDESPATYEIRLLGSSADALLRRFPAINISTQRAETLLFRDIHEANELDVLLERLLSMGVVLTEVHELARGCGAAASVGRTEAAHGATEAS